jgi:2-C-methyl-D-erythritol 2,4-cyclodiphosphate synthase
MRIGIGYDVHQLQKGRKLIIGGVDIPHITGLIGHSDADVLVHSVCDALLGAAALGDIGRHFPDTDQRYKDIDSLILLAMVKQKIIDCGYKIGNIDCTVIAEHRVWQPTFPRWVPIWLVYWR